MGWSRLDGGLYSYCFTLIELIYQRPSPRFQRRGAERLKGQLNMEMRPIHVTKLPHDMRQTLIIQAAALRRGGYIPYKLLSQHWPKDFPPPPASFASSSEKSRNPLDFTATRHQSRYRFEFQGGLVKASHVGRLPSDGAFSGGSRRGSVLQFSKKSRLRLLELFNRLDWDYYTSPVVFITLTYGQRWPKPEQAKKHLTAFLKRVRRAFPESAAVWRVEMQKRGAPHWHLMFFNLPFIQMIERPSKPVKVVPEDWNTEAGMTWKRWEKVTKKLSPERQKGLLFFLPTVWREVIGENFCDSSKPEIRAPFTQVQAIRNKTQAMFYLSKYVAKVGGDLADNTALAVGGEAASGFITVPYLTAWLIKAVLVGYLKLLSAYWGSRARAWYLNEKRLHRSLGLLNLNVIADVSTEHGTYYTMGEFLQVYRAPEGVKLQVREINPFHGFPSSPVPTHIVHEYASPEPLPLAAALSAAWAGRHWGIFNKGSMPYAELWQVEISGSEGQIWQDFKRYGAAFLRKAALEKTAKRREKNPKAKHVKEMKIRGRNNIGFTLLGASASEWLRLLHLTRGFADVAGRSSQSMPLDWLLALQGGDAGVPF